tara:strand:- start:237 stop:740 length:504 start_codon:yes stop_codon:yes gene_type:complete
MTRAPFAVLLAAGLVSCGNGNSNETVPPLTESLSSNLAARAICHESHTNVSAVYTGDFWGTRTVDSNSESWILTLGRDFEDILQEDLESLTPLEDGQNYLDRDAPYHPPTTIHVHWPAPVVTIGTYSVRGLSEWCTDEVCEHPVEYNSDCEVEVVASDDTINRGGTQ